MKICINIKPTTKPAGGGNAFARDLETFLTNHGETVVFDLHDKDIDIILHVNPFPFLMKTASFSFIEAYIYKLRHPKTIIIQGIHECDERKGTTYMNRLLVQACRYADYVVYVSSWLKPLLEKHGLSREKPSRVILHGSSNEVFNTKEKHWWDKTRPLRIVSHHWGGHLFKGHDVYQQLDALLGAPTFRDRFSFTFIGHYPAHLHYAHTRLLPPLAREELARELKQHDVYLTASRNEPAGLHHIEGALCGLPILYIDSGALKEYCEGYGIEFTKDSFESALDRMYDEYGAYAEKIKTYHRVSEVMGQAYHDLFQELLSRQSIYSIRPAHWHSFAIPLLKIYDLGLWAYWRGKIIIHTLWERWKTKSCGAN